MDGALKAAIMKKRDKSGMSSHLSDEADREEFPDLAPDPKDDHSMVSGDGSDPQHDQMGVNDHKPLVEQGSPHTVSDHKVAGHLKKAVQAAMGSEQGIPGLSEGDVPDGDSKVLSDARSQMHNDLGHDPAMRGGLESGPSSNQKFAHKPMAGARAAMAAKFKK